MWLLIGWQLCCQPIRSHVWKSFLIIMDFNMKISQQLRPQVVNYKNTAHKQSGTKPNLLAKICPPNLVTICAWLPKLVANVSSNFHRLVNTGLAIGSFFKWLPITVAHTCKLDTIWVVYISPIGNDSIWLQSPLTHYALWNFGVGLFSELVGAHT